VRRRHATIDWRRVAAFRNFAVHAYFAVDWEIVWITAVRDAPAIGAAVAQILSEPDPPSIQDDDL